MDKRLICFALVVLLSSARFYFDTVAQVAIVRGTVTDATSGETLPGVNVVLLSDDGDLVKGAVTDESGVYALSRISRGVFTLRATFVGFDAWEQRVMIAMDERTIINIALEPVQSELGEVVVEGDRRDGIVKVTAGQTTVLPTDIDLVPSPDVSGDLVNYLTAMPGIVSVGDRGGQLFVRGGEPWQNLVLLDGMWVYQPFHVLGFFSAFPSDIISSVDVYAGGFPSQFGGRLSSVMDVRSRNGNKRSYEGSAAIAPFITGFTLEGPLDTNGKVSFLTSYRESVIERGASHLVSDDLPYSFGDFYGKIHALPSGNSQLSISLLTTHDEGAVFEGTAVEPAEQVEWKNTAAGIRYTVLPNVLPAMAQFSINVSRLESDQSVGTANSRSTEIESVNSNADITYFNGDTTVRWGIFARSLRAESRLGGLFQNVELREEFLTEVGAYVEPEWEVRGGWDVRVGLRAHSFPSKSVSFLEPRLRLVRTGLVNEISLAAGIYHQEIVGLLDRRDAAGVFTAWAAVPDGFSVPSSSHLIVGWQRTFSESFELGIELYGKELRNLFIPEWTAFPRFTTNLQEADGEVLGGDFRLNYQKGRFGVFVTYGLSRTRYNAKQESLPVWFGTDELEFRPAHDRRHQINVVSRLDTRYANFSTRWQFGSGLPFNQAQGFDGFVLLDGNVDVTTEPGSRRVIFDKPFGGELPTYHRLDISAEKSMRVSGHGRLTLQAGVINIYDRSNLFFLDVFTQNRVDQIPIIPNFGLKLEFH